MFGIKPGTKKTTAEEATPYATAADFCRIFKQNMDRLYLLSFLLTADRALAERCFVSGLDASSKGNPVFKEWAESWARRTIILKAIQLIQPRPFVETTPPGNRDRGTEPEELAAIAELPAFERFTLVMSVLEQYSDQECSLLLNCTRSDVAAARTRAFEELARLAELGNSSHAGAERRVYNIADHGSALHLTLARLAPSA
jgi:DNA-directed RNA polymerase specialized sigma24 family protein